MAPASHTSAQVWQTTCRLAKQRSRTRSSSRHNGCLDSDNAPSTQTSTQRMQNVHSPCLKLTSGKPPDPRKMMPSGHAVTHSSQVVHLPVNSGSASAPGGRIGTGVVGALPRNRLRLNKLTDCSTAQLAPGGPNINCSIQIAKP